MDGWFSWRVIDVFFFSLYLCLYVCAECLQPAVPIWWSDLGSIMSAAGFLLRVVALAPTALWVIRNHLQQAYPITPQQRRVWLDLNGVYAASIDFHIWEYLYYCWSPIRTQQALQVLGLLEHSWSRQFNDRQPEMWARSYAVCLERINHLRLFVYNCTTLKVWQETDPAVCKYTDYMGGLLCP